ncbi:hypothetical protein FRC12_004627 [Ceratobasidium sp. 428]|nr:hypothetical protein FRC12_004627 [Ceratobasidium sp. 428]
MFTQRTARPVLRGQQSAGEPMLVDPPHENAQAESVFTPVPSSTPPPDYQPRRSRFHDIPPQSRLELVNSTVVLPEGVALACAFCTTPLQMRGGWIFLLRCGHLMCTDCYRAMVRQKCAAQLGDRLHYRCVCPFLSCQYPHWSELILSTVGLIWIPMKETGAAQILTGY